LVKKVFGLEDSFLARIADERDCMGAITLTIRANVWALYCEIRGLDISGA